VGRTMTKPEPKPREYWVSFWQRAKALGAKLAEDRAKLAVAFRPAEREFATLRIDAEVPLGDMEGFRLALRKGRLMILRPKGAPGGMATGIAKATTEEQMAAAFSLDRLSVEIEASLDRLIDGIRKATEAAK
jgi:hypothetical protein